VVFCTIADIGCGDGYWLEKISRWLVFGENDSDDSDERGVICLNIEDNKSERVEKQLKELTSLSPISRSSSSSSEIIERAVPMSSQDVQLLLKMGASGFHQTDASLNAARTYWNSNAVAKTSSSASAERGGGEVVVHEEAPQRKVTLSFHVRAFSKQKKTEESFNNETCDDRELKE